MRIEVTTHNCTATIRVVGELAFPEARKLYTAVSADCPSVCRLIVDLTHVRFMDSSGVNTLVQIRRWAADGGVELSLTGLSVAAHRVLEICGLLGDFQVE